MAAVGKKIIAMNQHFETLYEFSSRLSPEYITNLGIDSLGKYILAARKETLFALLKTEFQSQYANAEDVPAEEITQN